MSWYVYILECVDGSLYTGIAVDVAARYAQHASGKGAKYTRSHPPRQIMITFALPDRSSASKAEAAIRKLSALEKRRLISGERPSDAGWGERTPIS